MPLGYLGQLLITYKYVLLIPAAVVEGPIVSMAAGLLVRLGFLSFAITLVCLTLGNVLGDIFWYWVGRRYGEPFARRFGKYVGIKAEYLPQIKHIFHEYSYSILIVSKLTNGFGLAIGTLFTAGMVRISFWRFLVLNIVGESVWSSMLLLVGYYFGDWYLTVDDVLGKITLVVLFCILIAGFLGFQKFLKQSFLKKENEN